MAMRNRGHKVLFVCPTNKLACKYGEHGCTVNRFFGIGLTDNSRMAMFDDSVYDTVVFDEICFCSVRKLAKIKQYCESHPENIDLATGDTNQLQCIDCITNQHIYHKYYNQCIDTIFPNSMYLKVNKRLESQEDRETLANVKRDIFDDDICIQTTV